jgi:hypothetical protein
MACPHVSATTALILSSDETYWSSSYTNGDSVWTNDEVRAILVNTADDLGGSGRDEKYGYGLVDADEAAGTSEPPPPPPLESKLIVKEISMAIGTKKAGPNNFVWAIATVTVVDESDTPVEGATVYGQWSGATTDTDQGVTDINGKVSLTSESIKNPAGGTEFIFNIKDVTLSGWTYDPSSSDTSGTITYS